MTTQTKYSDTSRLYRLLESIDREMRAIGSTVRDMNDSVSDLLAQTECIYDAVTRHPESRYDAMDGHEFLDDTEE